MTEEETRDVIMCRGAIDETTVQIVDALFRHFAKQVDPTRGISIEDLIDGSWYLLERGSLRLVAGDDGHLAVESCGENRAERRAQAKKNRPPRNNASTAFLRGIFAPGETRERRTMAATPLRYRLLPVYRCRVECFAWECTGPRRVAKRGFGQKTGGQSLSWPSRFARAPSSAVRRKSRRMSRCEPADDSA
jgi:hypothetical protein